MQQKQFAHKNRSPQYKVSSLTEECLNNLRRGNSSSKTHLLGFMSEYIQESSEMKVQEVDELCCYDRMKKLLMRGDDSREERKEQEVVLGRAMQIEAKMNQMERELQQRVGGKGLLKMGKGERQKLQTRCQSQHFSIKSSMLQGLKEKGYEKFFEFQKIKKQTNVNKIKSMVGQQMESRLKRVIEEKDLQRRKLLDENRSLERRILQKNVQLQTLRSQTLYLKDNVKEMEEKLFGANNQLQNAHLIASYEKWLSEYNEHFGEMSIKELSEYLHSVKVKCLEKFDQVENRKEQRMIELAQQNQKNVDRFKKDIQKLQLRENELMEVNRNLKLNKQISQLQINQLQRAKTQLISLRQLVLSLYSQWYQKRTQNQKSLLKNFNKLKENYSYEDMLNYIVFYDSKLSTNDQLNDYILKILRGIQKIRRAIFPMQTNQKLDPFLVLDKIDLWVQKQIAHQPKNPLIDKLHKSKNHLTTKLQLNAFLQSN